MLGGGCGPCRRDTVPPGIPRRVKGKQVEILRELVTVIAEKASHVGTTATEKLGRRRLLQNASARKPAVLQYGNFGFQATRNWRYGCLRTFRGRRCLGLPCGGRPFLHRFPGER